MTEDGRIKTSGGGYTNGDNSGIGVKQGAGLGGHEVIEQGAKSIFGDEISAIGELIYGGPTSQHFGPMSQKATHIGGIRGELYNRGAYATFYEDGTAGFFGDTGQVITNSATGNAGYASASMVSTGRQCGRIRAF